MINEIYFKGIYKHCSSSFIILSFSQPFEKEYNELYMYAKHLTKIDDQNIKIIFNPAPIRIRWLFLYDLKACYTNSFLGLVKVIRFNGNNQVLVAVK